MLARNEEKGTGYKGKNQIMGMELYLFINGAEEGRDVTSSADEDDDEDEDEDNETTLISRTRVQPPWKGELKFTL